MALAPYDPCEVALVTRCQRHNVVENFLQGPLTEYPSRRSRDDVLTIIQLPYVFSKIRSTDACMTLNFHVITQRKDDLNNKNRMKPTALHYRRNDPTERMFRKQTFCICVANSLVGDRIKHCVSLICVSIV